MRVKVRVNSKAVLPGPSWCPNPDTCERFGECDGMGAHYRPALVCAALAQTGGTVYLAAKRLGCDPRTVNRQMNRYPCVRQAAEDARGEVVDEAEQRLRTLVREGNVIAILFTLKCRGKDRGWVDHGAPAEPDGRNVLRETVAAMRESARATLAQVAANATLAAERTTAPDVGANSVRTGKDTPSGENAAVGAASATTAG